MSKTKVLSLAQQEEVRNLMVQGVQPQRIADLYHVAISTIHNYKTQFKNEGTEIPSVKGRQSAVTAERINPGARTSSRSGQVPGSSQTPLPGVQGLTGRPSVFVINDVSIQISEQAKSVSIDKVGNELVFKIQI